MPELLDSLPVILQALRRGKVTPRKALLHQHKAPKEVRRIFDRLKEELVPFVQAAPRGEPLAGPFPLEAFDSPARGAS